MNHILLLSIFLGITSFLIALYERLSDGRSKSDPPLVDKAIRISKRIKPLFFSSFTANIMNKIRVNSFARNIAYFQDLNDYVDQTLREQSFPQIYIPIVKMNLLTWSNLKYILNILRRFYKSEVPINSHLTRSYVYRFDQRIATNNFLRESFLGHRLQIELTSEEIKMNE